MFRPGVYEAQSPRQYGAVKVRVTLSEKAIEDIEILEFHDMSVFAEAALAMTAKKIIALQSLDVEAVLAAINPAKGLLMDLEDVLTQAGGSAEDLSPNPGALDNVEQHMAPGTYVAEADGCWPPGSVEGTRFGASNDPQPIKIQMTVDETSIKDFEVLTCTDVDHFYKPVIERIPKAIVEEQSIFVDAVTGSTLTSAGVLAAAADALTQAGADLLGFSKTPERSTAVEEYDYDVCVVGAGTAGIVSAQAALEEGMSVIMIEKCGRVGGRGFCISGTSAVDSRMEEEAGTLVHADDFYEDLMEQAGGRVNSLLVREICEKSGKALDWLMDHGWPALPPDPNMPKGDRYMCSFGASQAVKSQKEYDDVVYKWFVPQGGKLILECAAKELIYEDGRVTGLKAQKQDGTEVIIHCKAAILATGGFGGNPEMLRRFCQTDNFYDRGLMGVTSGDSITMCEAVGAQLGPEIMPHLQEFAASMLSNYTAKQIKFITYAGFLLVNPEGKRFMDERLNISNPMGAGAPLLRIQGHYYIIMDQDMVDTVSEIGINGYYGGNFNAMFDGIMFDRAEVPLNHLKDDLEQAIAAGEAWKADTVEELAEKIGFKRPEVFINTFNRYNELCEKGVDEDFKKDPRFLNGYKGTLYAVHSILPIMGTLGGVKVNERLEVVDMNDEAIPGLYVVGQEGSGFYCYPYYTTMGTTATYAYTGGWLAAVNSAEYIRGLE